MFLDFNGVVMRKGSRRLERRCVRRINHLLARLDAHIVITSSRRVLSSLSKLNAIFNGRVVGATPDLDYAYYGNEYIRYREVLEYLEAHGWESTPWIALDDRSDHFPRSAPVFLTNSQTLITDEEVARILSHYQDHDKGERVSKDPADAPPGVTTGVAVSTLQKREELLHIPGFRWGAEAPDVGPFALRCRLPGAVRGGD